MKGGMLSIFLIIVVIVVVLYASYSWLSPDKSMKMYTGGSSDSMKYWGKTGMLGVGIVAVCVIIYILSKF